MARGAGVGVRGMTTRRPYCDCREPWTDPDDDDDPATEDDEIGFCWRCRRPIRIDPDEEPR